MRPQTLLAFLVTVLAGWAGAQTRTVMVNTNGVVVAPTNFWTVNSTNISVAGVNAGANNVFTGSNYFPGINLGGTYRTTWPTGGTSDLTDATNHVGLATNDLNGVLRLNITNHVSLATNDLNGVLRANITNHVALATNNLSTVVAKLAANNVFSGTSNHFTGDIGVGGTLYLKGTAGQTSTIDGSLTVNSNLNVGGATVLTNNATIGSLTVNSNSVFGASTDQFTVKYGSGEDTLSVHAGVNHNFIFEGNLADSGAGITNLGSKTVFIGSGAGLTDIPTTGLAGGGTLNIGTFTVGTNLSANNTIGGVGIPNLWITNNVTRKIWPLYPTSSTNFVIDFAFDRQIITCTQAMTHVKLLQTTNRPPEGFERSTVVIVDTAGLTPILHYTTSAWATNEYATIWTTLSNRTVFTFTATGSSETNVLMTSGKFQP